MIYSSCVSRPEPIHNGTGVQQRVDDLSAATGLALTLEHNYSMLASCNAFY